tara:strand:+ start:1065 stop:1397 length:333 start_codon:yes stop_codon:yes gene_type:complete
MKRYHDERHITYRNWQEHLNIHRQSNIDQGKSPDDIHCPCDRQMGRFHKRDAYDCGNTRCFICHSDKLLKIPHRQEILADIAFQEQLDEFNAESRPRAALFVYKCPILKV